jgi:tRNA (guanine37-N1)-methyltransferase
LQNNKKSINFAAMRIDIISVIPDMMEGFINESILARAQKKGLTILLINGDA